MRNERCTRGDRTSTPAARPPCRREPGRPYDGPSNAPIQTVAEAKAALDSGLRGLGPENADNPVAAARVVAGVARRCQMPTRSSWEAVRWAAARALQPYFDRRDIPASKAVAWAVVDPFFGLMRESPLHEGLRPGPRAHIDQPTAQRGSVTVAGGAQ